jgi:hypothetical protein
VFFPPEFTTVHSPSGLIGLLQKTNCVVGSPGRNCSNETEWSMI